MPRTGTFGGFAFDPEVFADYMAEQPTWSNAIIASGILQEDNTIMGLIGDHGNVATLPFYQPISIDNYTPLNNDGLTNNVPNTVSGSKQTAMLIQRMAAWKAQDFTKELTGADPMAHIARSVNDYYKQVWEAEMMNIVDAVMGLSAMADHKTDIATTNTIIGDANKIDETTLIYAQQKALGDMANGFGIVVMNSYIYAKYQAMGLVNFNKYTIANGLTKEVSLPTINGLIPVVSDRYTTALDSNSKIQYKTYIIGRGAILTADKKNYENPYYTDYDAETNAGIEKLYTKQGKVLHPNGFSLNVANIAKESPTKTELGTTSNWALAFDHKNVKIGEIISNG